MPDSFPLGLYDGLAIVFFLAVWTFYAYATDGRLFRRVSLTQAMNRQREAWMRTMARRELRMIDTGIMAGLQQGTAFFASSSLIALGGCFALLNSSEQVMAILADLPLGATQMRGVLELKILGLVVLLAYSFFKFAWSYRLFNYCSILIGAVPVLRDEAAHSEETEAALMRATRMNVLGGKHFNAGLRGIFFSIGYLGWFIGPAVLAATSLFVLLVLVRRQFFSQARLAVLEGMDQPGNGESMRPASQ
ncbi:MAG: DUF599 domain-containing protein [Rhizobiaceae bacterium]